jgi:putative endonuclease
MPADARMGLGRRGEDLAATQLAAAGLTVIARNWRCPEGELDLVAQEEAADWTQGGARATWLVIVEVRTRRGAAFGSALASVTPRKAAQLRRVAEVYVQSCAWTGPWRIDVVAVQMDSVGRLQNVEHLRGAVTG